jgi:hypothetical protein
MILLSVGGGGASVVVAVATSVDNVNGVNELFIVSPRFDPFFLTGVLAVVFDFVVLDEETSVVSVPCVDVECTEWTEWTDLRDSSPPLLNPMVTPHLLLLAEAAAAVMMCSEFPGFDGLGTNVTDPLFVI